MKRVIWTVFTLGLLLLCGYQVAYAAEAPVVIGEEGYTKPGQYVDYSVSISGNSGLSAFVIYVDCDPSVFQVDYNTGSASYQVECGTEFQNGTMSCNVNGTRGWVVSWYLSNGQVAKDGELFTLRFLVDEGALTGEHSVKLRYSEKDTLDANMRPVALKCVPGAVHVSSGSGRFYVENRAVVPGETFNLKVKTDASPGISSYMVYLLFDTSVFSAVYDEEAENYQVINGEFGTGGTILCNAYNNRGYRIVWYAPKESYRAGTLFELPLQVSETAAGGTYPIQIAVSAADITNEAGERVPVTTENGALCVAGFSWGDVSFQQGQSFSVNTAPNVGEPAYLMAAAYSSAGKMEAVDMKPFVPKDNATACRFDLKWARGSGGYVKLFALDAETLKPISEVYWVIEKD